MEARQDSSKPKTFADLRAYCLKLAKEFPEELSRERSAAFCKAIADHAGVTMPPKDTDEMEKFFAALKKAEARLREIHGGAANA